MRLYLTIQRGGHAQLKTVWPWPLQEHEAESYTFSDLIADVNETFPLSSDCLQRDYMVTLKGFECLLHQPVASVCKDEDELVIRALTISEQDECLKHGRWKATPDGALIKDGVILSDVPPYFKDWLTIESDTELPNIGSPPRHHKRRRLNQEEPVQRRVTDRSGEQNQTHSRSEDDPVLEDLRQAQKKKWQMLQLMGDGAASSESESESSSGSSDSAEDDSDEDDSDSSAEQIPEHDATLASGQVGHHAPVALSHALPPASEESESADINLPSTAEPSVTNGVPFQGLLRTKARNVRRREKKRLHYLQAQGSLGPQATFEDLRKFDQTMSGAQYQDCQADDNQPTIDATGPSEAQTDIDKQTDDSEQQEEANLMSRKARLLNAIASGGIDVDRNFDDDEDGPPEQLSSKAGCEQTKPVEQPEADALASSMVANNKAITMMPPSVERRRARLDVGGSARLLFGSLGVRAPKTDVDKAMTREKLAARGQTRPAAKDIADIQAEPILTPAEYEDWQSRIILSAVECIDEGVVLSTPSFPFKQRWDAQYSKPTKRRRRPLQSNHHVESYDKYNASGNDALNYDDVDMDDGYDEEHWEEGALLDEDVSGFEEDAQEDTFPPLPENVESLPPLDEGAAAVGDYVVYTELVCSTATQWQPSWVSRTVQLIGKTDTGWKVKLALRDVPQRTYDEEGNRVYDKFEMQGSDNEDEDESAREVVWSELVTPRLLLRT